MTEFVITLPVFITVFLGIIGLWQFQDAATRAHPVANRLMWEQAYESANSEPSSSWGDPGDYDPFTREDKDTIGYDQAKFMRLSDQGTLGEALTGSNFAESSQWRFGREMGEPPNPCAFCVWDFVYGLDDLGMGSAYAYLGTADSRWVTDVPRNVEPEIQPMLGTFPTKPKSRLAYGAGTRYGIAYGQASRSVSWKGMSATFTPGYQVTAPSRTLETADEAFGTVSAARVQMERHFYRDMPGFEIGRVLEGAEGSGFWN